MYWYFYNDFLAHSWHIMIIHAFMNLDGWIFSSFCGIDLKFVSCCVFVMITWWCGIWYSCMRLLLEHVNSSNNTIFRFIIVWWIYLFHSNGLNLSFIGHWLFSPKFVFYTQIGQLGILEDQYNSCKG